MVSIAVYTALFGDIDRLWGVPVPEPGVQYVAFTDRPRRQAGQWAGEKTARNVGAWGAPDIWQVRVIQPPVPGDMRRCARWVKAQPHKLLNADVFVWVDANVRLLTAASRIVNEWLQGDLAIFAHPDRQCLYQEAEFCAAHGKDDPKTLHRQAERYRQAGMPTRWGLPETRCMIRTNTDSMRELGERWWAEMERGSCRDQVSLPFVCWQMGIRWNVIPGRCWVGNDHEAFWYAKHGA